MGENIFKLLIRQGTNIQKIQRTLQLNSEKKVIKTWAQDMNRHFSKDHIHVANRFMKKSSTSLTIREMQIKTTRGYYFSPIRVAIIKKKNITDSGEDAEKRELLYMTGGNIN